jgi:hypothetical protein
MEALEQRICSRCHCRRPIEHFEGTTWCRRCRAARKADAATELRKGWSGGNTSLPPVPCPTDRLTAAATGTTGCRDSAGRSRSWPRRKRGPCCSGTRLGWAGSTAARSRVSPQSRGHFTALRSGQIICSPQNAVLTCGLDLDRDAGQGVGSPSKAAKEVRCALADGRWDGACLGLLRRWQSRPGT